jgi:Zn-dependent alcohol dehydrogenase
MNSQAIIGDGEGGFEVATTEVGQPRVDEVLVRIRAAGVCHTDWDSLSWGKPIIVGHEGAGEVVAIGENVASVLEGDRVLLNWAISCGDCFQCLAGNTALCEKHSPVAGIDPLQGHAHGEGTTQFGDLIPVERSFNLGTMSEYALVRKEAVIAIPDSIGLSFESACILGCGVMTGYGSVINAAQVEAGASVVVIGCGGVGLNCIQGARIAAAEKIIALDLSKARLKIARQFGATDTLQPDADDRGLLNAAKKIRQLTDHRGADYAFEATAVPALGAAPLAMIRHGGTAVQCSGIEQDLTIDMNLFEWDKTYLNPLYGKCSPQRDFPRLFKHYADGDLLLNEQVSKIYALDELDLAFADMHAGRIAKGVIRL